jgi:hypothetical protein
MLIYYLSGMWKLKKDHPMHAGISHFCDERLPKHQVVPSLITGTGTLQARKLLLQRCEIVLCWTSLMYNHHSKWPTHGLSLTGRSDDDSESDDWNIPVGNRITCHAISR